MKEWPAEGPELLWLTEGIGKGYSSPVVADGKVFVTGMNEAEDKEDKVYVISGIGEVVCLKSEDGSVLWRVNGDGPHWSHPVIDDGVLYIRQGNALMAYKIKE